MVIILISKIMNTQLEKSLITEASFSSVTQRLNNDLRKFSDCLILDLANQSIAAKTFVDVFNNLAYEQKQTLVKSYSESSFSILAPALNSNMGATNESASILFDFLMQEGFKFNKADLSYLKKHDNLAFKRFGSFGSVYEVTWYYPLNKWADKLKQLVYKALKKNNSPIYLIHRPSQSIHLALLKHYEKLPKPIQSIVLRDASGDDIKIILNKAKKQSSEDFNFFKKPII